MTKRTIFGISVIALLASLSSAQAYVFKLSGDGITATLQFKVGPDPYAGSAFGTGSVVDPPGYRGLADPSNAQTITSVSGLFSDANLHIANALITGLVANTYTPHFEFDNTLPYSFSWYTNLSNPLLSFDNLFYAGSSAPITCTGVPPGGFLDNYGVLVTLSNGDVAGIWSDGGTGPVIYGAAVASSTAVLDYQDTYPGNLAWTGGAAASELSFSAVPESSTWIMLLAGFACIGLAGRRVSRGTERLLFKP